LSSRPCSGLILHWRPPSLLLQGWSVRCWALGS